MACLGQDDLRIDPSEVDAIAKIKGMEIPVDAEELIGRCAAHDVVDTATGSFRALGAGITTNGVSLTLSEPLTEGLWAALEFVSGAALETGNEQGLAGLQPASAEAATVAVKGRVLRTGTKLRAAYRWQPRRLATPVGPPSSSSTPCVPSGGPGSSSTTSAA